MAGKGSVCSAGESQLQDFLESDSDPEGEPARVAGTGPSPEAFPRTQVIHSGHFMVSSPHSDSAARRRKSGGSLRYDFDTVNRTGCQTYRYGPLSSGSLSIDPTLTRLFECMSLAYRWVPAACSRGKEWNRGFNQHFYFQLSACSVQLNHVEENISKECESVSFWADI